MVDLAYDIVATLGPATPGAAAARELVAAGATALRLNTSHLGPGDLERWLEALDPIRGVVPLVLDLQGSKWRVAAAPPRPLETGAHLVLALSADHAGDPVVVPHPDFFRAAGRSDGRVLLDDARIELRLETTGTTTATARVIRGGLLGGRKGVTLPATTHRTEELTPADRAVVSTAGSGAGIRYAVSYVRDAAEMARYRALLPAPLRLTAKLERPEAMTDAAAVALHCDELWVCRGDLGAEMGFEGMARAVWDLTSRLATHPRPVLMAGQVLEHMTHHTTPTRAEVCNLHDVLQAGYRGVVLSDETAVGGHPREAVRVAALFRTRATP